MRAAPLAVTTLAAALLLTACGGGDDSDDKATASPKGGSACAVGPVDLEVGPANAAPAAGDTGNIPVTLTNQSAPCTLEGFPAVGLKGSGSGSTISLAKDTAAQPQKLTLAKGDTASFTITYVRGKAGAADSLDVRTLDITLPGEDTPHSYKWSYGPVQGKGRKADALNASVSAFGQAGD
ncbi:DUF4232 domain-containing protein [Streptomyces griseorubiginosus]|uniref:DUF4232 domain-containing protein n=1 Tax=Streptomyces griseorubiginosus TaxID=67304 RepID=UPI00076C9978|nr:DUF4232 domain-containing protein [Streptomyces griseorubiginosus]KUM67361.1 hypothetical protein AQI84_41205 [Streptomyces griseorubiginosus]